MTAHKEAPVVQTHAEPKHDPEHGGHTLIYWLVGLTLAVVTILEVFAASLWFSSTVLLLMLLVLAFLKGGLVVAVFMHLQGDAGIFKFVFLAPFSIAITFMLAFLLLFSGHVGIAG